MFGKFTATLSVCHTTLNIIYIYILQQMLSYVEPIPMSLKQVKLNMGTSIEEADFSKDVSRKSQKHLLDHFINGQELKNEAKEYIENLKIEYLIYKSNQSNRLMEIEK